MLRNELFAIQEVGGNGMLVYLNPGTPVVITPRLVENIRRIQDSIAERYFTSSMDRYFYVIWYLQKHSHFTFCGLDFTHLVQWLKSNNEHKLEHYINRVFNLMFLNHIGLGLPVINCSIVASPLTGLSRDFFLLNKICFIYNRAHSGVQKIELSDQLAKCSFGAKIYEQNHYFCYRDMQLDKMNSIIDTIDYQIPDPTQIETLRMQFELLEIETLKRIYTIASKNMKILERKAQYDQSASAINKA